MVFQCSHPFPCMAPCCLPVCLPSVSCLQPVVDGPTATKAIRLLGYTGKVFGITGNALQSDVDTFLAAGADAVFPKPLDVDALLGAVAKGSSSSSDDHRAAPPTVGKPAALPPLASPRGRLMSPRGLASPRGRSGGVSPAN